MPFFFREEGGGSLSPREISTEPIILAFDAFMFTHRKYGSFSREKKSRAEFIIHKERKKKSIKLISGLISCYLPITLERY